MEGHGRGQVYIDGVRQERLIGFKVEAGVGQVNKLTLILMPDVIEFDGEAEVE